MPKKIILLGYMGCGKSTIALQIAQNTGLSHYDLDEIIQEKEKLSIPEIFNNKGELYFRKQEHLLFKEIIHSKDNFVLSIGGGTPCYYNNHLLLQKNEVTSIYLKLSLQELFERLVVEKQKRPLLANIENSNLKDFIAKHLFEREFYYNYAKKTIKTDNKSIKQIADEISNLLA